MVGLLILKHLRNISDESVVEQYSENVYYQYLCGQSEFIAKVPCEASELNNEKRDCPSDREYNSDKDKN